MRVPELVCFDFPCLVQVEPQVPAQALERALRRLGLDETARQYGDALDAGLAWPGIGARAVLGDVFPSEVWADAASAAYDDAFGACISRGTAVLRPGAQDVVCALRRSGATICLTTEFSAATRESLLDVLGWSDLVAMLVSDDPFRDPPRPDPVTVAVTRSAGDALCAAVIADSVSGVAAGRAAGVGWVVGVVGTGASELELRDAGATATAHLPELVPSALAEPLLSA